MNKQRILNGMSEEEFYSLYPTEEHYKMAMGGSLSGAPYNGQPTEQDFFSMDHKTASKVFYKSGGDVPCMNCGGYMQDGGTPDFKKEFRALMKKAMGGDMDPDDKGGASDNDQDDYLANRSTTFMNSIKQNTMMSLADQASKEFGDAVAQHPGMQAYAQMGMSMEDYGYNPYMNNQQEYMDASNALKTQGQNAMSYMQAAGQNMLDTQNPFTKTSVQKAQYGTNVVSNQKMTPQQWEQHNNQQGFLPVSQSPGMNKYKEYYNPKEYTPGTDNQFTRVGDIGKTVDYNNDPTYKPINQYGYKAPVVSKPTPEWISAGLDPTGAGLFKKGSDPQGQSYYFGQGQYKPYTQGVAGEPAPGIPHGKYGYAIPEAQDGMSIGPNFNNGIKSPELIQWLKNHNSGVDHNRVDQTAGNNQAQTHDLAQAQNQQGYYNQTGPTQGMQYLPMNFRPYGKMSAQDVATMKQLQANPTTQLKKFKHRGFGPWSSTTMTFGAKDLMQPGQQPGPYNNPNPAVENATSIAGDNWFDRMRMVRQAKAEDHMRARRSPISGQPSLDNPDINSMYDGVNDPSAYGENFPQVYRPGMSPADMMSGNLYRQPTQQGAQDQSYDWENMMNTQQSPYVPTIKQVGGAVDMYGRKIPNQQQRNTFGFKQPTSEFQPTDQAKRNAFGYTPPAPQGPQYGAEQDYKVKYKQRPGFDGEASANAILAGMAGVTSIFNKKNQTAFDKKMQQNTLADNSFGSIPANEIGNRGDYNWTGMSDGMLRPDNYNVVQNRGNYGYGAYGGEMDNMALGGVMKAGLGQNTNNTPYRFPQGNMGKMGEAGPSVRNTMTSVPRGEANVEVEDREIIMTPGKGGVPNTFQASGNRHTAGGVPLHLDPNSFVFSDTKAMKITDPKIQAQFGMAISKSGYTPAEIAKKYKINPSKQVLADKNSDKLQRDTHEKQIADYNLKLSKLSLAQESKKGFPQGLPAVAMPYIEMMKIDPAQFIQMNPGEGQDTADAMAQYGMMMQQGGGISDAVNYLVNKQRDVAKKQAWNKLYQQELKKGYADLAKTKEEAKAMEKARRGKYNQELAIKEGLMSREGLINRQLQQSITSSEPMGLFNFPTQNADTHLEKSLYGYIDYKNKNAPTTITANGPQYAGYNPSYKPSKEEAAYYNKRRKEPAVKLEDLGNLDKDALEYMINTGTHFIANGKTY